MFEALKKLWTDTIAIPEARVVIWGTVLLILIVTGIYLAKFFRDFAFAARPSEADRINDMRKLKEIGALNDTEYRRAKEALSAEVTKPKSQSETVPMQFHQPEETSEK